MNTNSENPKVGKIFQEMVCKSMSAFFDMAFDLEVAIPIGYPPKRHKFDCVSENQKIVVECKCYTWTDTGNVPSAKMMGMNEAIFYMGYLPKDTTKILCIRKSIHEKKSETLAEYYCRINNHLLADVKIFEVDDQGQIRVIKN